tara:strand:- start:257 stop:604 length:348 start_codon:yes stop_codon:yes gene_type:complete
MLCLLSDIKEGKSNIIKTKYNDSEVEIIILRDKNILNGFVNICPHASLPLNLNDTNVLYNDNFHLICRNHAALFNPLNGICVSGPCEGKSLEIVKLKIKCDKVYIKRKQGFSYDR